MWMWNEMSLKFIIVFYLVKHYIIINYAIHESMKRQICVLYYIENIFPLKSDFRPQVGYRVPKKIHIVFIFFFSSKICIKIVIVYFIQFYTIKNTNLKIIYYRNI